MTRGREGGRETEKDMSNWQASLTEPASWRNLPIRPSVTRCHPFVPNLRPVLHLVKLRLGFCFALLSVPGASENRRKRRKGKGKARAQKWKVHNFPGQRSSTSTVAVGGSQVIPVTAGKQVWSLGGFCWKSRFHLSGKAPGFVFFFSPSPVSYLLALLCLLVS